MAVYNSTHTGEQIDTILNRIVNLIYPVGSVYISLNDTSPSTLFGGTWQRIEGKFLLGCDSSHISGSTGGNSSHTHTTETGVTGGTALTVAQMPQHGHLIRWWSNAGTQGAAYYYNGATKTTTTAGVRVTASGSWQSSGFNCAQNGAGDQMGGADRVGSGETHTHSQTSVNTSSVSNIPPYLAVYMW